MAAHKVIISCAITGSIHTPSMSPYLPVTPEEIAEAERTAEWFFAAFRDEDYAAQTQVQNGLASVADSELVIGRNEIAVQYAHDTVRRLMAGESVHGPREWLGR